ncbi:MAG: hypothetical protein HOO67_07790 [Candidatus Peribacteraceae bacterium]|nr:hypothetical protein [Candidatus Peribacteraceae bacterium]
MTSIRTLLSSPLLRSVALGTFCAFGAFAVGIETAGNVDPVSHSQAALQDIVGAFGPVQGDANGNGALDAADAYIVFQAAEGLSNPSADQTRRGDTDGDGLLTEHDLNRILHLLSLQ